jgi:hypothetical protein
MRARFFAPIEERPSRRGFVGKTVAGAGSPAMTARGAFRLYKTVQDPSTRANAAVGYAHTRRHYWHAEREPRADAPDASGKLDAGPPSDSRRCHSTIRSKRVAREQTLKEYLCVTFLAILSVLHVLEPEFNPPHLISEYQLGCIGWLMSLAFFCLGAASLALFAAARRGILTRSAKKIRGFSCLCEISVSNRISPLDKGGPYTFGASAELSLPFSASARIAATNGQISFLAAKAINTMRTSGFMPGKTTRGR